MGTPHRLTKLLLLAFFGGAVALRALLCWANPPANSFDDHFAPIFMTMKSGAIPAKDACFQCYHPPVFYGISALIGNLAVRAGAELPQLMRLLQSVACLYGILAVGVCYLIIRKFPLSDFSILIAFGTVCFLPHHTYMSAMHSNGTLSNLLVALAIYVAIVVTERGFRPWGSGVLSAILTIAQFAKYTALVVLPIRSRWSLSVLLAVSPGDGAEWSRLPLHNGSA